ncbi:tRNA preQ1(34) S-adenosylmethionine ribosyltransferase-isomerase QueA [Candidatus Saccharibacteria bacterium]|nr:tRNA preQ1(34) S-adenosylmethionine ribosyltransferase-isomerase QueA [Candidatus Saccharibacteria bacterium]
MLLSDYDYALDESLIAKYPPKVRGASRLLGLNRTTGQLTDSHYRDLADFLQAGDVLVLNETKVMSARMFFLDEQGREREVVLLEKHGDKMETILYRGKLREGEVLALRKRPEIKTKVLEILGGGIARVDQDLLEIAVKYGEVPLPPYLKREADQDDTTRYQTEFAKHLGSAAAPTASLNLTEEILQKAKQKGVRVAKLTLHVGLGTFLPIRTDDLTDHKMHSEYYEIPPATLAALQEAKRVVAVGTTVVRALESFAETKQPSGETKIFIYPGYQFKLVGAMLTNFHAPKSTVLMMAAAFAGWENLRRAYEHAAANRYAFLSYGDSMMVYS